MSEAIIEKVSDTVEKESHEVQEKASEAVGQVSESVEGVADEGKEEVVEKVADTKKSIASLVSHGLSKAEEYVHSAKDYVDTKGTDLQGKIGLVSDSFASWVKKSKEAEPLPVSGGSSSPSPAVATDRGLPENQPLLSVTAGTRTSWTNCFGLFDCLTSTDR